MNDATPYSSAFLQEAAEQLTLVEEIVLEAEDNPSDKDAINRLFRVFHTIKGSGAMFGFDGIASFTHHLETILHHAREGRIPVDRKLMDVILASKDHITLLLSLKGPLPSDVLQEQALLLDRLAALLPAEGVPGSDLSRTSRAGPIPSTAGIAAHRFIIDFKPGADVFARGLDPASIFAELRRMGACEIDVRLDEIPTLSHLRADQCYFGWRIVLITEHDLNAIRDVFIFVEDGGTLHYEDCGPVETGDGEPSSPRAPLLTEAREQAAETGHMPGHEEAPSLPMSKQAHSLDIVRVPSWRLNRLLSVVGELVINRSRLAQLAGRAGGPELEASIEGLERLVNDLRDNVLEIRMMPIGSTFNRYRRLVRDLSTELGKEIDLITEGGDTELDKSVLDQLGDTLVHLLRNAIDHGIARPGDRERAGKARRGTIRLSASHAGANVIIRIDDDGNGLDLDAIRLRAQERGLVLPESAPSESELISMVFLPGFSTVREVTSVSGRGVGLDVVKRQIDSLRGSVTLSSEKGLGTSVHLTLPLTLAIIDGLLVEIAGDRFILPLSSITENVELARDDCATGNGRNLISVRGELVPFLRLRDLFGFEAPPPEIERIVIVSAGSRRFGLVVDRILGTHQTVIQSLGRFYREVPMFSGATIMGDGFVALIIDVSGIAAFASGLPSAMSE